MFAKAFVDIVKLRGTLAVTIDEKQDSWTFRNSFAFVICATTTIGTCKQ